MGLNFDFREEKPLIAENIFHYIHWKIDYVSRDVIADAKKLNIM